MKNIKRNIAIVGVASLLMSVGALNANAQGKRLAKADCSKGVALTDQQKEQIKETKIEFAKATKDLRNELNELRAHKQTLMSAEKPDMKAIYTNIDKESNLKSQLKKEQLAMRLEMKSIVPDEQRARFANRSMRKKGMKRGGEGEMKKGEARMNREGGKNKAGFQKGEGQKMRNGQGRKGMKNGERANRLNLSDEQQVQMKNLRLAHMKESKELKFQAEELQLKQRHLMSYENVDEALVMKNVELLSGIENKLAKMRVDHKMEVRKVFTEDQLSLFLSHESMRKDAGNGHKHRGFRN